MPLTLRCKEVSVYEAQVCSISRVSWTVKWNGDWEMWCSARFRETFGVMWARCYFHKWAQKKYYSVLFLNLFAKPANKSGKSTEYFMFVIIIVYFILFHEGLWRNNIHQVRISFFYALCGSKWTSGSFCVKVLTHVALICSKDLLGCIEKIWSSATDLRSHFRRPCRSPVR